jgi:hypothetical protein
VVGWSVAVAVAEKTDQEFFNRDMLQINIIMNSAVEEIFAFKTCCGLKVMDQNLEIHVKNVGGRTITIPSWFYLERETDSQRISAVTPAGEHRLAPGEMMGFYCYMDEELWHKAERVVFEDLEGQTYSVGVHHEDQ